MEKGNSMVQKKIAVGMGECLRQSKEGTWGKGLSKSMLGSPAAVGTRTAGAWEKPMKQLCQKKCSQGTPSPLYNGRLGAKTRGPNGGSPLDKERGRYLKNVVVFLPLLFLARQTP